MRQVINKAFNLFVFFLFLFFTAVFSSGGEFYKWVDEDGTVHITDNPASIPPKYRNQAEKRASQVIAESDVKPESQIGAAGKNAAQAAFNLRRFEVPYKAFEGMARRIIIPVTFNNSITADLLLDTGSPGLLLSSKLASRLGLLDEEDGNLVIMTGGIGGSVPAMLAVVDSVKVGDASVEFLPATITDITSDDYEGLVGMDFIANYQINIDSNKSVVAFTELPPEIDRPGGHDESWWRSNFQRFSSIKAAWNEVLHLLKQGNMISSEKERMNRIAKKQYDEAETICRKLEIYARNSTVPITWRH